MEIKESELKELKEKAEKYDEIINTQQHEHDAKEYCLKLEQENKQLSSDYKILAGYLADEKEIVQKVRERIKGTPLFAMSDLREILGEKE